MSSPSLTRPRPLMCSIAVSCGRVTRSVKRTRARLSCRRKARHSWRQCKR